MIDNEHVTPILMAAMFGHLHIVKYLSQILALKCSGNHYSDPELGASILHWACLCGLSAPSRKMIKSLDSRHVDTVRFILKELKVPVDCRASSDGSTPLIWACSSIPLTKTKQKVILEAGSW